MEDEWETLPATPTASPAPADDEGWVTVDTAPSVDAVGGGEGGDEAEWVTLPDKGEVPIIPMTSTARNLAYGASAGSNDVQDAALWLERNVGGAGRVGWNTEEGFFYHTLSDIYGEDWDSLDDAGKIAKQQSTLNETLNSKYADVLASGGDETVAAAVGAMATAIATPTTAIPATSAYKLFKASKGVAKVLAVGEMSLIGGFWGAETSVLDQLAREGTVSPEAVANQAALSAIIAPVLPLAGRSLVKGGKALAGKIGRSADMSNKQASRVYQDMQRDVQDGMSLTRPSARIPEDVINAPKGEARATAVQDWIADKYRGVLEDSDTFLTKAKQEYLPNVGQDVSDITQFNNLNGPAAAKMTMPREMLQSMDFAIESLDPKVAGRLRKMELSMLHDTYKHEEVAFSASAALKEMDDERIVWDMLQDQEWGAVERSLYKGGYGKQGDAVVAARKLLEELGDTKEKLGIIKKQIPGYFPRSIKDKDKLFEAMPTTERTAIDKALAAAQAKQKAPLTEYQENQLINSYFAAPAGKGGGKVDRARQFTKIPEKYKQYYHTPEDALHIYMKQAADDIETARFFGDFSKYASIEDKMLLVDDSVGAYVSSMNLDAAGVIKMKSLLNSMFGMGRVHSPSVVSNVKAWTYAGLLGNIRSTVTQFGDVAASLQAHGVGTTATTILNRSARKVMGKQQMVDVLKDAGIANVGHEMASTGGAQKYLKGVMKASGFKDVDMMGKNVFAEASLRKQVKMKGYKDTGKLYDELVPRWGLEDTKQLVTDLAEFKKGDKPTDLMLRRSFEDLTQWQPITPSSLPQGYADNPRGRLLYTLSTWSIRMLNNQHKRIVKEFNTGDKATAIKELTKFALFYGILDTGGDYVKDAMNGKEMDIADFPARAAENLASMFFLDRYARSDLMDDPFGAVKDRVVAAPPIEFMGDVYQGVTGAAKIGAGFGDDKDAKAAHKLLNYVPIVGPILYNRTGGNDAFNEKKIQEQKNKRLGL